MKSFMLMAALLLSLNALACDDHGKGKGQEEEDKDERVSSIR